MGKKKEFAHDAIFRCGKKKDVWWPPISDETPWLC